MTSKFHSTALEIKFFLLIISLKKQKKIQKLKYYIFYQKKSWLRMKSLSSALTSASMASAASFSRKFWKKEGSEKDDAEVEEDDWLC